MAKALIVFGGWDGHQPRQVAHFFADLLRGDGVEVDLAETLDAFDDGERLKQLDLIVPVWTMGQIKGEQASNVCRAVGTGVGLAGAHGGMTDAFRGNLEWHWITGGQFLAHPGNIMSYPVHLLDRRHPILEGLSDFTVESEQYYMMMDPGVAVLATTPMPLPGVDGPHLKNGPVQMPVIWTKFWSEGRVFHTTLGHQLETLEQEPIRTIVQRGFRWAMRKL